MRRTLTSLMIIGLLSIARLSHAGTEDDASIDEVDAAAIEEDAGVGDDEVPIGLQPTVFDSNLGCNLAPEKTPVSSAAVALLGLSLVALARRRRRSR